MKLYGHPSSTCTRKVLTVLAEKDHSAELVEIDLGRGTQKSPEHLARHPFGVIPVLDDRGFVMYESRAIIRYLDAKLPGIPLTPMDPHARARMDQWMSVEQSYFAPAAMKVVYHRFLFPMRGIPSDESVVEQGRRESARALDVIAPTLSSSPYLAGETFSLADICWMPYVEYLFATSCGDLITERDTVRAWWDRISNRLSWKRVTGKVPAA